MHPLVRWQYRGGIPEEQRKAFLFTNVVDSTGRRYEAPGPRRRTCRDATAIYARRDGLPSSTRSARVGRSAQAPDRTGHRSTRPGARSRLRRRRPQAVGRAAESAGPDLDARLRQRALFRARTIISQRSRDRRPQLRQLPRTVQERDDDGVYYVPFGNDAARSLGEERRRAANIFRSRSCVGAPPVGRVHRGAAHADRARRVRRRRRPRGRADAAWSSARPSISTFRPTSEVVDRRLHAHRLSRARRAVRRISRLRPSAFDEPDRRGHRDHASPRLHLDVVHQPGDAERVERDQARRLRADVPELSAQRVRREVGRQGRHARGADQYPSGHLLAVPQADRRRSVARAQARVRLQDRRRQTDRRRRRRHRADEPRRDPVGARLSA